MSLLLAYPECPARWYLVEIRVELRVSPVLLFNLMGATFYFFNFFLFFLLFLLGLCVGSFLNVLIYRLPRSLSITGRSFCPKCKKKIPWRDNLPILSFILLGGRCRFCRSPIGIQYPVVELTTGVLFVLVYLFHLRGVFPPLAGPLHLQGTLSFLILPYQLLLISALIVVFFTDLKSQIIPDQIVYPAIFFSLIFLISQSPNIPISPILSASGAALFFLTLVVVTRGRGMGWGDVKLAGLMGLILGFPKIIVALYLAFLTGAIIAVILVLVGKKRFGQSIPFGPFLSGATIASLFWGQNLWQIFQKITGWP